MDQEDIARNSGHGVSVRSHRVPPDKDKMVGRGKLAESGMDRHRAKSTSNRISHRTIDAMLIARRTTASSTRRGHRHDGRDAVPGKEQDHCKLPKDPGRVGRDHREAERHQLMNRDRGIT